jgi:hypothetical protein
MDTVPLPRLDRAWAQAHLVEFRRKIRGAEWGPELLAQPTRVSAGFLSLLALIDEPPCEETDYDEGLTYLREMLVRAQFLRETEILGGPPRSILLMTLGHALCCRAPNRSEPHAERLVGWFRLLTTNRAHHLLNF